MQRRANGINGGGVPSRNSSRSNSRNNSPSRARNSSRSVSFSKGEGGGQVDDFAGVRPNRQAEADAEAKAVAEAAKVPRL
eukprot:scaffold96444_cov33-Phaeocystis_antarctica.AAC.2